MNAQSVPRISKKSLLAALALGATAALVPTIASATPSSTVWTPMSLDIQPYGVGHWGVDNYFTVFRKAEDGGGSFPTDAGFTVGVLPGDKLKLEIGVDLIEASDYPVYFNAKLGYGEGGLFDGAPVLQLGIANVGTESGVTNQNLVYLVVGKTIPHLGRLSVAPYHGNPDVLVDAAGEKEDQSHEPKASGDVVEPAGVRGRRRNNTGFMVAFDRGFHPVKGPEGEFNRFVFAADYASGDNALGAGAVGLYYFFTPNVSLLAGPVWFNEEAINGKMKWTIQLDINHLWWGGK